MAAPDTATLASQVEDMLTGKLAQVKQGSYASTTNYYNENVKSMQKAATIGTKSLSSTEAMNRAMFQRAQLMERVALAHEQGNVREAYLAKARLLNLDAQVALIKKVNLLEARRLKLADSRRKLEDYTLKAQKSGAKLDTKHVEEYKKILAQTADVNDEYNEQRRTLQKVASGVLSVKDAHQQVAKELQSEQDAYNSYAQSTSKYGKFGAIDATLGKAFGEHWDNVKKDLGGKLAVFTSVGASAALAWNAFKDLSHDSDEVTNSVYRMGESISSANQGITGFWSNLKSTVALNSVQGSLRRTAAALNLPTEAVEGMTDAIMDQMHVFDSKMIQHVSETALGYARATNTDTKDAISLISTLDNKLGYSQDEIDTQMQSIVASVTTANDEIAKVGGGHGQIWMEDIAKMMAEAAQSTDGFALSLKGLALNATKQMQAVHDLGGSYVEQVNQAKTMSEFLTKRNPLVNYQAGKAMMGNIRDKYKDLIATGNAEELTKRIQTDYGVKSTNEANIVAKYAISGRGMGNQAAGTILGGTEQGQTESLGLLEKMIREKIQNAKPGQPVTPDQLANLAGTMGIDVNTNSGMDFVNNLIQQGAAAQKTGNLGGHFLAGNGNTKAFQENLKKAKTDEMKKNAPITQTSLKETIEATFKNPLNQLILATGGMVTALGLMLINGGWQIKELLGIKGLVASIAGKKALGNVAEDALGGAPGAAEAGAGKLGRVKGSFGKILRFMAKTKKGRAISLALITAMSAAGAYGIYKHQKNAANEDEDAEKLNTPDAQAIINDSSKSADEKAQALKDLNANNPQAVTSPKNSFMWDALAPTAGIAGIGAAGSMIAGRGVKNSLLGAFAGKTLAAKVGGEGADLAAHSMLRGLPVVGGLISGALTGATTEGPMSRKLTAGLSDAVATTLGDFGGPLVSAAAGYAAQKASTWAYDKITGYGNAPDIATPQTIPSASVVTPNTPNMPVNTSTGVQMPGTPTIPGMLGFNDMVSANGRMQAFGNDMRMMISFPMNQMVSMTQKVNGKLTSTETGLSGIR